MCECVQVYVFMYLCMYGTCTVSAKIMVHIFYFTLASFMGSLCLVSQAISACVKCAKLKEIFENDSEYMCHAGKLGQ